MLFCEKNASLLQCLFFTTQLRNYSSLGPSFFADEGSRVILLVDTLPVFFVLALHNFKLKMLRVHFIVVRCARTRPKFSPYFHWKKIWYRVCCGFSSSIHPVRSRTHVRIKGQNLNFYLETHATPHNIHTTPHNIYFIRLRILPRILGTLYWRVDDPLRPLFHFHWLTTSTQVSSG